MICLAILPAGYLNQRHLFFSLNHLLDYELRNPKGIKMALEFEQPESIESSSNRCTKPGHYHVMVTDYVENPVDSKDYPMEGAFEVSCEIVEGTEKSEIGKTLKTTFYPPAESHKDGGKFALLRMTKFYLAINKGIHQPGQKAVISYETAVGRQFIVQVKEKEAKNDPSKKYIEFDGANTWHVDDLLVADYPKSEEYLQHIDEDLRMVAPAGAGTSASGDEVSIDDL